MSKVIVLDPQTIAILRSFNSINNQLIVNPGNQISIINSERNVLAQATGLKSTFPQKFALYQLNQFLSVLSMWDIKQGVQLDFSEEGKIVVSGEGNTNFAVYQTADPSLLTQIPQPKDIASPSISFSIPAETMDSLIQASSVLKVNQIIVHRSKDDNGSIFITVADAENPATNSYCVEVENAEPGLPEFRLIFDIYQLKLLAGSYQLKFHKNRLLQLINLNKYPVQYWISLHSKSSWEENNG